ncbi:MAG: MFS transporter, partial [Eubacterium sp.]|nr:MFS transporter [Eubacterium sp.]
MKGKVLSLLNNVRFYWKEPPRGKYMSYKEVAAYAFGGIGAYFVIQLGSTLIVSTTNLIVNTAIGVGPTHAYIIYLIATILNIPLTAIRANMIDNTRGKGGKYRPYLLSMGIPTALIALVYVWFPYARMYSMFPGKMLGYDKGYWIKVAVVFICNLALHFFFNFFRDAYENLIHVLSPNTQERTDVLAVKAVVYSLAPSIMNILNPVIANYFANSDQSNIIVYRITYPIYAVLGIGLTIVVWANTKEKIVQAKTHTIQIRFMDALKEVAKNKYFWIIALAGWLGFLELAYSNILYYSQTYGHTVNGNKYALAWTLIGNASLWGMLFTPFFVKRFGKKAVLITANMMNIVCIMMMIVNIRNFWWLVICVWVNYLFGSVEQITTPAIQADIRDFQQYKSGERIDGMFAAVA